MDFVAAFNVIEAVWWIGLGGLLLARPIGRDMPRFRRSLAVALIAFGLTDAVEVWSGAWWRPWWLGVSKIGCGTAIAALALLWFRTARRVAGDGPRPASLPEDAPPARPQSHG